MSAGSGAEPGIAPAVRRADQRTDSETPTYRLVTTDGRTVSSRVRRFDSFAGRLRGLIGSPPLAGGEAVYLSGANGVHMLFMGFAIDCIFLDRPDAQGAQRVVALRRALPPWRGVVWYVRHAAGVVEAAIGTIDAAGLALGDELRLETVGG